MSEDRNTLGTAHVTGVISRWRSPLAVSEDRNLYLVPGSTFAVNRVALAARGERGSQHEMTGWDLVVAEQWRSPLAVSEDRNRATGKPRLSTPPGGARRSR